MFLMGVGRDFLLVDHIEVSIEYLWSATGECVLAATAILVAVSAFSRFISCVVCKFEKKKLK